MQFPFRDLTNQYISLSYQDVVQRYTPAGTSSFFLDGLGYVLFSLSNNALGSQLLTPFDTASWAITASYAMNGGGGGGGVTPGGSYNISTSFASASISSSYAYLATLANVALVAENALSASISDTASFATSASRAAIAGYAFTADTASYILGNNVDGPVQYANSASYAATSSYELEIEISTSFASSSISSSHALIADVALNVPLTASNADTASIAFNAYSASWAFDAVFSETASQAISSNYSDTASYVNVASIDGTPLVAISASYASASDASISSSHALFSDFASSASYAATSSYELEIEISSSFASASITASYAVTASNLNGWNFTNTSSNVNVLSSDIPVIEIETGSYNAAFFDYVAMSGSNCRAGILFGSWVDGLIDYTEVSNVDVGDTSKVTMSLALNGGNVQFLANVTDSTPWKIKALGRYL